MSEMKIVGAEQSAPEFVLRDLKAMDVWQFVRILTKLDLKNFKNAIDPKVIRAAEWKPPMMMNEQGEEVPLPREKWTDRQIDAELQAELANDELLWSILGMVMEHIGSCEYDVNRLLAMGTGKTVEEIQNMDAGLYMELIAAYISREGFRDFFTQAWNLLQVASSSKKSYGNAMATLIR